MPSETEVDRLLANLRERFGSGLTDEQAAVVRERLGAALEAGERLRAVPLDNSVAPFNTFTPHRGGDA